MQELQDQQGLLGLAQLEQQAFREPQEQKELLEYKGLLARKEPQGLKVQLELVLLELRVRQVQKAIQAILVLLGHKVMQDLLERLDQLETLAHKVPLEPQVQGQREYRGQLERQVQQVLKELQA